MSTCNQRNTNSKQTRIRFLALSLVLMLAAVPFISNVFSAKVPPAAAAETEDFSIWLEGPTLAAPGQTLSFAIKTDATGLYGAQFDLVFDPAVVQVVDADTGTEGVQIMSGDCPVADFIATNEASNASGKISYAASSLNPTPPCDGGTVASFQFQVSGTAASGITPIQWESLILADNNGEQIPATGVDFNLQIAGPDTKSHVFIPLILSDYPETN
jgi:hypothetical protein